MAGLLAKTFRWTYYEWKYIIRLKCFWWLLIHFISILQIQSLCIYCTKAEKIRISDLSPTITIQQYYYMFMLKYQSALSVMKTHSFSFMLGLGRAVCDIISLKSASKQRNKSLTIETYIIVASKYLAQMSIVNTLWIIAIYIYSTYITNGFTWWL